MDPEVVEAPKSYGYMEEGETILSPVEPPKAEEQPKEEPKQEAPKEAAKEVPKEAPKEPVSEVPKVEPEKPAEVTAVDWKAALKTADKYEALKEMGYDDFAIDALKYYEKTKTLAPYAEAKSVDYTKMTAEQLFRLELKKNNPALSEKALNFKFNKEFSEKYYLNRDDYPEDSDEAIYGQEQLQFDAEQKRKAFIEEQSKFKAPEPQPDLDATRRDAELQQQKAALGNMVMNNDATQNLQKAKTITFGEGEESFNYPIEDPKALVDIAMNTILNSGRTDLNGVDLNLFYRQLAKGQPGWDKAYADHIRALEKDKFQKEIGNITPKGDGDPIAPPPMDKDYGYKTR